MKPQYLFLLFLTISFAFGCKSTSTPDSGANKGNVVIRHSSIQVGPNDVKIEPPPDVQLLMSQIGPTVYVAGMPAVVTIALRNAGGRMLEIPTWHLREADNIVFHYIRCDENGNIPPETKPSDWTTQSPVIPPEVFEKGIFMPLALSENCTSWINGELLFIEEMPTPPEPQYYLVVAVLNQPDLPLSTPPFVLTIVP